jgi:hypothetical protein
MLLIVGTILNCCFGLLFSSYYLNIATRTKLGMICTVMLTLTSNVCLLVASIKRYFILLPEKLQEKAEHFVICFVGLLLMFCFSKTSMAIVQATDLEALPLAPWIFLLAVIPLMHIVFGIAYFIYLLPRTFSVSSQSYQLFSLQSVCTIFMVILWASWSATQLLGISSGGSNNLFMALGFELESSVGVITMSLSKLGSPSLQRHTTTEK